MIKHNYFVTFLKKIYLSINRLLKKYLNKLNSNNLSNITTSNKVFLIFVAVIIIFLSYLSIPNIYNKEKIHKELESQLLDKFKIDFIFSKNLNYKFFPRPHFVIKDSYILNKEIKISSIEQLKIFVSLENLFSLKNIKVNDVVIENANFTLNKNNFNFFFKLLNNNFSQISLKVKDSNIFFHNLEKEVLFINKILDMRYYYDTNNLKNVLFSKNEVFNIPYTYELVDDKINRKLFSKINLNFLKLKIKDQLDYTNKIKKGSTNFIFNKNKSKANYEIGNDYFNFELFEKLTNSKFLYVGKINLDPFYSSFDVKLTKLNLSNLLFSNSFLVQLLKTEILNNKNLNINLNLVSNKINQYQSFSNIFLYSKIHEGLIDIDETKFSWNDSANLKISNSLIYVNENQLLLDGELTIDVVNSNEFYRFLQISKKLRPELKKIQFNFNYNFDQQIMNSTNFRIDDQNNEDVGEVLKKIILKKDKLQNKIHFKNLMKKAIQAYSG